MSATEGGQWERREVANAGEQAETFHVEEHQLARQRIHLFTLRSPFSPHPSTPLIFLPPAP